MVLGLLASCSITALASSLGILLFHQTILQHHCANVYTPHSSQLLASLAHTLTWIGPPVSRVDPCIPACPFIIEALHLYP